MTKHKDNDEKTIFSDALDLSDIEPESWRNYIGPGYRNCCYTVDKNRNGRIFLFGYDTEGNPKTFTMPSKSWIKYRVKYETDEKDIYGNCVATKWFKNVFDRKKYLDDSAGLHIVEALRPESECLRMLFDKDVLDPKFNTQPLRTFYLDIETEISDTFMQPKDALNRINMITVFDTKTDKFYTWSLQDAVIDFKEEPMKSMDKKKFRLFTFNNKEGDLLDHFLIWWERNYPDVVCGYNSQAYDIPYIVRRIENVFGEDDAKRLSPIGRYRIREVNHMNMRANVAAEIEVDISGIFSADELILYRDKFKEKPALDGGYSLSKVGEAEGLGKKVVYSGTLKDLYEKDYQKFYEYNVRDVDLLKRIEEQCKLIPRARRVSGFGLTNYDAIYTSISYLIGSLASFAKTYNGTVFQSYLKEKKEGQSYEGAYVFEPVQGIYRGGIYIVDYNSLYPSTIRALNLSPETYVGKIEPCEPPPAVLDSSAGVGGWMSTDPISLDDYPDDATFYLRPANNGKRTVLTKAQLVKLCKTKCIFTKNNTLFLKHSVKQGIVSAWCKHFYALRKDFQKQWKELNRKLYNNEIKGKAEKKQALIDIENLYGMQLALKIMLNSVYGIMGTAYSPIGNPDLAQTITRNGKFCNISASKYVKKIFMERYGVAKDYVSTISGDTDSQFINGECIKEWFTKEKGFPEKLKDWSDEQKLELWDFVNNFVENELNPYVQNLLVKECFTEHPEVLRYSLEYIGDTGIFEMKKHYGIHKIISEGPELVDKIKYVGIELKKATVPVAVKAFLKDIYENTICNEWTSSDFVKYMSECYDKFSRLSVNDVALWKGWASDKIESTGFLAGGKGMTGISKACHFYNEMLDHLQLGKKYDSLKIGDKVRFVYICPNTQYRIECMAFPDGSWPEEFNELFEVDYPKMFQKLMIQPLEAFFKATRFEKTDPREKSLFDLDDL